MKIITNTRHKMNCSYDTSNIRLKFADNSHIGVAHCCYKEKELVNIKSFDEIYKMSNDDFWNYLQESYKMIPDNHNYEPAYYCNTTQKCYYNDKYIDKIAVSLFRHCNLNCKMCLVSSNNFLSLEESKKIYFDVLYKVKGHNLSQIGLTQNGEPFLCKKETFDYLESLTVNDFKNIDIVTNVLLLNDDDILKLANIKKNINITIMASCSGITPETYSSIHCNNKFDKVINNIKKLHDSKLLSSISYVIQNENLHELPFVVDFWKNMNIHTTVYFHPIIGSNGPQIVKMKEYLEFKKKYPSECVNI